MQQGVVTVLAPRRRVRENWKQRMITSLVVVAGAAAERIDRDGRSILDADPYDSGR
ncbi:MAG: hypothetical protein PGN13_10345 [Patulibacter minatonensis]